MRIAAMPIKYRCAWCAQRYGSNCPRRSRPRNGASALRLLTDATEAGQMPSRKLQQPRWWQWGVGAQSGASRVCPWHSHAAIHAAGLRRAPPDPQTRSRRARILALLSTAFTDDLGKSGNFVAQMFDLLLDAGFDVVQAAAITLGSRRNGGLMSPWSCSLNSLASLSTAPESCATFCDD